jgi:hypothetical protein
LAGVRGRLRKLGWCAHSIGGASVRIDKPLKKLDPDDVETIDHINDIGAGPQGLLTAI